MSTASKLIDLGLLPDGVIRAGIRKRLGQRLANLEREAAGDAHAQVTRHMERLAREPVATETGAANAQHYEVPAAFYEAVLGPRLKYSSAWFGPKSPDLPTAEIAMLEKTVERAGIRDGMDILDLGCGWGSLSLFIAERFPNCRILAVSNSNSQREHIEARAPAGVEVVTCDVNDFDPGRTFDRIVSVEMLEHVRNQGEVLRRIASWLKPEGRVFIHVFVHARYAYPFEVDGKRDWMARHFFTGGQMPAFDLLPRLAETLELESSWEVNGTHYARTARAWLENLDTNRRAAEQALRTGDNPASVATQIRRWRVFFMACEELWAYRGGREWLVAHYLFRPAGRGDG